MNRLIASALSLPAWALVLIGIWAVSTAAVAAIVIGAEHEDGDRDAELSALERQVRGWLPEAMAHICGPCNGHPGTLCICHAKCPNPACGAEDTTISDSGFHAELFAMLDKEGGRG